MQDAPESTAAENEDRRAFLKSCGRFASSVPPAMVLLLSTSLTSEAIAKSNGGGKGKGKAKGPKKK